MLCAGGFFSFETGSSESGLKNVPHSQLLITSTEGFSRRQLVCVSTGPTAYLSSLTFETPQDLNWRPPGYTLA